MRAKIVHPPTDAANPFFTTTKNTDIDQGETLEEIMLNLATLAGAEVIHKRESARRRFFYEVQRPGFSSYQSASNTILELSRILCARGAAWSAGEE